MFIIHKPQISITAMLAVIDVANTIFMVLACGSAIEFAVKLTLYLLLWQEPCIIILKCFCRKILLLLYFSIT